MHAHTTTRFIDGIEQGCQVGHDFVHHLLFVVVRTDDKQSRTGDSLFQIRGNDLDSKSGFNLLVMDIGGLRESVSPDARGALPP